MTPITCFAGKTVAVFGLGGSGLASCRALQSGGALVVASDDSAERLAEAARAGFVTADLRSVGWSNFAALVLTPGVPLTHPEPHWTVTRAQDAGVEIIGDIELFCRERRLRAPRAPFIAITGTNGKSTTTALTAHLLRSAGIDVQMGGNIGAAILSLAPPREGRAHVIEMSSYQIDLTPTLDPTVGIMLNVTEDHLDRHGTMAHYAEVKERLVAKVQPGGTAVIGVDDDWGRGMADRLALTRRDVDLIRVSVLRALPDGIALEGDALIRHAKGEARVLARLHDIGSLRGAHNAQNAACAAAAALALGVSEEAVQAGLRSFPGLAHRMEQVGFQGDTLFVNDSKATNADAAARALSSFQDIFWIAGGKPKTGGIASLAEFFPRIRKAYLIGEAAQDFAATLEGKADYALCGALDQAVPAAARDAAASGLQRPIVLLSPACASFDQFRNFELRGDHFRKLVEALPGFRAMAGLSNR